MTQEQQIAHIRLLINEPFSTVPTDKALESMLLAGAEAFNDITRYNVTDSTTGIGTLVAGTQEYAIDQSIMEIEWFELDGVILPKTDTDSLRSQKIPWRSEPSGRPEKYYLSGRKVGFYPKPSAAFTYVMRCVSVPTDSYSNMANQHQRIPDYFAAAEWLASARGQVIGVSPAPLLQIFAERATAAKEYYVGRGVVR